MVGMDEKDLQEMLANLRTRPSSPTAPECPELDNMMAEKIIVRLRAVSGPPKYYSAEERATKAYWEERREDPDYRPVTGSTPNTLTSSSEDATPTRDREGLPNFTIDEEKSHDVCANLPSIWSESQVGEETIDRNAKDLSRELQLPEPGHMSFGEILCPSQDEQIFVSDPDEHISKKRKMIVAEDSDTTPALETTGQRSTESIT